MKSIKLALSLIVISSMHLVAMESVKQEELQNTTNELSELVVKKQKIDALIDWMKISSNSETIIELRMNLPTFKPLIVEIIDHLLYKMAQPKLSERDCVKVVDLQHLYSFAPYIVQKSYAIMQVFLEDFWTSLEHKAIGESEKSIFCTARQFHQTFLEGMDWTGSQEKLIIEMRAHNLRIKPLLIKLISSENNDDKEESKKELEQTLLSILTCEYLSRKRGAIDTPDQLSEKLKKEIETLNTQQNNERIK